MICVYAIAKNEEENVSRFIEQTKLFDQVVVLDTGSEDRTVELLREAGIKVEQTTYRDFDFSVARTAAMELADPEVEWFLWLDFNEKLEITEEQIEQIKNSDYDGFKIDCYDHYNEDYLENKLKIHRRDKYYWDYAVHEFLKPVSDEVKHDHIDVKITKKKRQSYEKDRFQAMICEREHDKNPNESHYSWWAINFYRQNDVFHRAAYHAYNYLRNTEPYTVEFRVYSFIYASEFEYKEGKRDKAIDLAIHALSESIIFREKVPSCFQMALSHLNQIGVELKVS